MTSRRMKWLSSLMFVIVFLVWTASGTQAAIEPDFLMDSDPELRIPEPIRNFNPALKELWLAALHRPEIDMQRMAAETIARAHKHGIPDLIQAVPRLEEILLASSSHPSARFASARALIVLDSRASAQKLFEASQTSSDDLRQLIEPTLARWEFAPIREVWNKRLDDPETRRRDLILAMRGLAQVHEPSVLARVLSMAEDSRNDPDLRLEAAATAGHVAEFSLAENADRLAKNNQSKGFISPLCAVRLLARDPSEPARKLLLELAGHAEPAVAAAALIRLNEIDLALVVLLAEAAMKNPDQRVRLEGVKAYLNDARVDRIAPLAQLLADPHPAVRREVCEGLARLSQQPELLGSIQDTALQLLNGDRWQGQEQAALLLGQSKDPRAANRLVELLESPRPDVSVTAAWALRKLAVPETIPALIDKATRQTERRQSEVQAGLDDQVAHLFETLGELKSGEALPLLLKYIPKQPVMGERSRSAAIWAIGRIKEGTRDAELEDALSDRITDFPERDFERDLVKQMCAVTLARMKAENQAPMMRGLVETLTLPIPLGLTLRWAVKELTGEELPPPKGLPVSEGHWFLEPLR